MVRRKNTADCREVLRKIYDAEVADQPAAQRYKEDPAGPVGDVSSAADEQPLPAACERQARPLLGKPAAESSDVFNRHGGIRSTAPGAASPAGGDGGLPEQVLPAPADSSPPVEAVEPAESMRVEGQVVHAIESRDSGQEPSGRFSAEGEADHFAEESGGFSLESGEGGAGGDGASLSSDDGTHPGGPGAAAADDGTDPVSLRMAGAPTVGPGGDASDSPRNLQDEASEPQAEATSPVGAPGSFAAFRRWISRDGTCRIFGRHVGVRASTMVMSGLSAAIFVGLLGLYFNIDRTEGTLAGRILDDRQGLKEAPGAMGSAVASTGSREGKAVRSSANVANRGSASRVLGPGGIPVPARPLWSRNSAAGGGHVPGVRRPPVRNIQGRTSSGAAAFVTTSATRWLRVRDLMGKEECAKLLDHLSRLQKYVEERDGCHDESIACKELKSRMTERHGEDLYAVDIGPFASWKFAQAASAGLKEMTRRAPWVFRNKMDYFAESYPRKP